MFQAFYVSSHCIIHGYVNDHHLSNKALSIHICTIFVDQNMCK